MHDVKDAVQVALNYFQELFRIPNASLEEVELSDDERFWYVTVGFIPSPHGGLLGSLPAFQGSKEYKVVKISAENGKPVSVKIRKP